MKRRYAKLPQLFGRLPKAKLEVVATQPFREKEAASADYDPGALRAWADRIRSQPWAEAFVFFKHEDEGLGPKLAHRFLELWNGG